MVEASRCGPPFQTPKMVYRGGIPGLAPGTFLRQAAAHSGLFPSLHRTTWQMEGRASGGERLLGGTGSIIAPGPIYRALLVTPKGRLLLQRCVATSAVGQLPGIHRKPVTSESERFHRPMARVAAAAALVAVAGPPMLAWSRTAPCLRRRPSAASQATPRCIVGLGFNAHRSKPSALS